MDYLLAIAKWGFLVIGILCLLLTMIQLVQLLQ